MGTGRYGGKSGSIARLLGKQSQGHIYKGDGDNLSLSERYLKGANPHRNDWLHADDKEAAKLRIAYRENCQRVAYATDLRLAGYRNIEAQANPGDNAGLFSDSNAISYKNVYKNAQWSTVTAGSSKGAQSEIDSIIPNNPGARAIVRIRWKQDAGGGGHVFNIVRQADGSLLGIDGQIDATFPINKYLDNGSYTRNNKGSMKVLVTNNGIVNGVYSKENYEPSDLLRTHYIKKSKKSKKNK